jgi:AraC family transcriptional regulator of arabinose operon
MTTPVTTGTHSPFGVLSAHVKDFMYLVRRGYLFTSPWVVNETTRYSASILLTANRAPFEMSVAGRAEHYQAVAIKPFITRQLRAENVQLGSIGVSPNHRHYRKFRSIHGPGFLPLDRDIYRDFDDALTAAYNGKLHIQEAAQLFEDIVNATIYHLPRAPRPDARIERAIEMLQENPHYPLTQLAAAVGLSYDRMSHAFAESVGLPLRSYLLWQKLHMVSGLLDSGMTLTEIAATAGFTDSAHLSKAWQKAHGMPPSYYLDSDRVEIRSFPHTTPNSNPPRSRAAPPGGQR